MPLKVTESYQTLTEDKLTVFEGDIGTQLPEEYRQFLLRHNGGVIFPDTIKYFEEFNLDASTVIDRLLGLEADQYFTITRYKDTFAHRIPANLLPIATDVGGNVVCIAISGQKRGQIFFWHHEYPDDNEELPGKDNLFFIASNFLEFLNKLYVENV